VRPNLIKLYTSPLSAATFLPEYGTGSSAIRRAEGGRAQRASRTRVVAGAEFTCRCANHNVPEARKCRTARGPTKDPLRDVQTYEGNHADRDRSAFVLGVYVLVDLIFENAGTDREATFADESFRRVTRSRKQSDLFWPATAKRTSR
jgi:hypothetical protein